MLIWLEVAWPNPGLTALHEITELARILLYLVLFFFFWWPWVSALPPASVFAGLVLLFLVEFAENIFFNFQVVAEVVQGLSEFGLAFILSECEHCGEDWIACCGHYGGIIIGLWFLSFTGLP